MMTLVLHRVPICVLLFTFGVHGRHGPAKDSTAAMESTAGCGLQGVDLLLLVDATKSMDMYKDQIGSPYLDDWQAVIESEFPSGLLSSQGSVLSFRDKPVIGLGEEGDYCLAPHILFTNDWERIRRFFVHQNLSMRGGGSNPREDTLTALVGALQDDEIGWRDDEKIARIVLVLTDAPPHTTRSLADNSLKDFSGTYDPRDCETSKPPSIDQVRDAVIKRNASVGFFLFESDTGYDNSNRRMTNSEIDLPRREWMDINAQLGQPESFVRDYRNMHTGDYLRFILNYISNDACPGTTWAPTESTLVVEPTTIESSASQLKTDESTTSQSSTDESTTKQPTTVEPTVTQPMTGGSITGTEGSTKTDVEPTLGTSTQNEGVDSTFHFTTGPGGQTPYFSTGAPVARQLDINLLFEWESAYSIAAYRDLYREVITSAADVIDGLNRQGMMSYGEGARLYANSTVSVWIVKDKALEYPFCGALTIRSVDNGDKLIKSFDGLSDWWWNYQMSVDTAFSWDADGMTDAWSTQWLAGMYAKTRPYTSEQIFLQVTRKPAKIDYTGQGFRFMDLEWYHNLPPFPETWDADMFPNYHYPRPTDVCRGNAPPSIDVVKSVMTDLHAAMGVIAIEDPYSEENAAAAYQAVALDKNISEQQHQAHYAITARKQPSRSSNTAFWRSIVRAVGGKANHVVSINPNQREQVDKTWIKKLIDEIINYGSNHDETIH